MSSRIFYLAALISVIAICFVSTTAANPFAEISDETNVRPDVRFEPLPLPSRPSMRAARQYFGYPYGGYGGYPYGGGYGGSTSGAQAQAQSQSQSLGSGGSYFG